MAELGIDRLDPKSFGSIIDDIEYQKSFLFHIILPKIDTKQYMGKLDPSGDTFELCTSSTALPSLSTAVQPVSFYNSELKILTKTTYSNWNATFRMDANRKSVKYAYGQMNTWEYFYCWQLMANWPYVKNGVELPSFTSALPKDYKYPIDLFLLKDTADLYDLSTHYQLQGVTPISITGGTLDYSADSILTYNVEFAFDRFIVMSF